MLRSMAVTLALLATPLRAAETMDVLAKDIVAYELRADPFLTYYSGVPVDDHDRLADISPAGIAGRNAEVDALLARLDRIDPAALTDRIAARDHAIAREMLEAERGLRVCRNELWSVSHMSGWPSAFPDIIEQQAVATVKDRADALARWGALPAFVAQDIANLKQGLALGYSSPRSVAQHVLVQVEGVLTTTPEESPFYSPAARSDDPAFKAAFVRLIAERINPALRQYRDFLREAYIPAARTSLSILGLPEGRACYNARLRSYTTLDRPGEAVSALGEKTVAANVADVERLGRGLYGAEGFAAVIARMRADPANHFGSEEELVAYSRDIIARARVAAPAIFDPVPTQPIEVRPMPERLRASGASSYFISNADPKRPATFMLQIGTIADQLRSDAAITAVHEATPGHHLQFSYAAMLPNDPLTKIAFNSAYVEGWARYAERLAEEMGVLDAPQARIARRAWPARGMVVDPGIHLFGWSREQALAYLQETGRFPPEQAADLIDRIAILPGQLTAYDSGGLEILALREEARKALGDRFDLKAFHAVVLRDGIVPLAQLRRNVEHWIAARTR